MLFCLSPCVSLLSGSRHKSTYLKANIPYQGNMGAYTADSEEEAGFDIALLTAAVATTVVVVVFRLLLTIRVELGSRLAIVEFHRDVAYILFLNSEPSLGIINLVGGLGVIWGNDGW